MADTSSDKEKIQEAVTDQPASSNAAFEADEADEADENGPKAEMEIDLSKDECVSASAEYGSVCIKECCGGATELDFLGPAIGCTLSKGDGLEIVSDCTTTICTSNFVIAELVLCTLGLSFDTKLVLNTGGAEFLLFGTGLDTSEGFALAALGSKVGYANMEKVKKAKKIRLAKQEKKAKQTNVVEQQPTGRTDPTTEQN